MDFREKKEQEKEIVAKALAKYSDTQKRQVFSQLPYQRFENDEELNQFINDAKTKFDGEATEEDIDEAFKYFR